jgi:hypothetical protein
MLDKKTLEVLFQMTQVIVAVVVAVVAAAVVCFH